MGYNTTVVVLNDAIDDIANDPEFGRRLATRIRAAIQSPADVSARNYANAAAVVETHHADGLVPVLVGGNMGVPVRGVSIRWNDPEPEVTLLQELARKHGFHVSKRRKGSVP